MCEYMEYTIKAKINFYGEYQGLFKNITNFSEYGYITLNTIAISEDEAFQVLLDKIKEQCDKMMQRGEFHFYFDDDFYGDDFYLSIQKLQTVHGIVVDFTISADDPRKWPIKKVIDKCTVEEAVAIFGERIGWLLGSIRNVEE